MNKYSEGFPKQHSFLPVIHCQTLEQSLRNTKLAFDYGADGIFLIDHRARSSQALIDIFKGVRESFPEAWIGLNFLNKTLEEVLDFVPAGADGLWTDTACIQINAGHYQERASKFSDKRKGWKGLYFGGVNFKYRQSYGADPYLSAKLARPYVDVITTTGLGTGFEPSLSKIQTMREAIDDHPLGIASGVGSHNIEKYLEYNNAFLVATAISKSHTELDPVKVKELRKLIP